MVSASSTASSVDLSPAARAASAQPASPTHRSSRARGLSAGPVTDASVRVLAPLETHTSNVSPTAKRLWQRPAAIGALAGVLAFGMAASAFWAGQQSASPEGASSASVTVAQNPAGAGGASALQGKSAPATPAFSAVAQRSVTQSAAGGAPQANRDAGDKVGAQQGAPDNAAPAVSPVCSNCGVVESVRAVQHKGQGTGVGAVTGGVLGGVLGHQMGGGHGKDAMTVLGAIGGGLAGNEVEKRARAVTTYQVQVRLDNGQSRTLEQARAPGIGTRVRVEGQVLKTLS